jgi:hypothetical protein
MKTNDKLIEKLKELILHQKKLIYQLDKQPNAIGQEWRERVEGIEIEIKEITTELAVLESEQTEEGDGKEDLKEPFTNDLEFPCDVYIKGDFIFSFGFSKKYTDKEQHLMANNFVKKLNLLQ